MLRLPISVTVRYTLFIANHDSRLVVDTSLDLNFAPGQYNLYVDFPIALQAQANV
jgi:hypothetical protein